MLESSTGVKMSESNQLATRSAEVPILSDLKGTLMSLNSSQIMGVLVEFTSRRSAFRSWLLGQLRMGVHYGVPPGCEPRGVVNPDQWQSKPSLYKSGADFIVELMQWQATYENDVATWEMLGKPTTVCYICKLMNGTGKVVGEGRGARPRGAKKMDDNATVKLAKKNAKVDAVIDALNLSDLFTQDIEDLKPVEHGNPDVDPNSPRQATRSERISSMELKEVLDKWKSNNEGASFEEWAGYVAGAAGRDFDVKKTAEWTRTDLEAVQRQVRFDLTGE